MKPPISLWMEIEARCNLACRFCYNFWRDGSESYPRVLPTSDLLRGLDSLFENFACRSVAISGGEPLLRTDIEEIVRFLKARQIRVVVTTNGTMITADKADALRAWGVDTVQVSLHSTNAAEHDWISSGQAFEPALRALMLVRERGIGAVGVFVATSRNLAGFPGMLRLLAQIDIRTAILNRFIPSGLGARHHAELGVPDDDTVLQVLFEAQAVASKTGQTVILGTPIPAAAETRQHLPSVRFGGCPVRQQQSRWTIGTDGEIRRCNHSSLSIGNILGDGVSELVKAYSAPPEMPGIVSNCDRCQLQSPYFTRHAESAGAIQRAGV